MSKHKPKTLSVDQIRAYQEGRLSGKQAHEVERMTFDSDFDEEGLEGLSSLPASEWEKDLVHLRGKLATKKKAFPYLQIAAVASILILASVSIWLLTGNEEKTLAFEEAPKQEMKIESMDSPALKSIQELRDQEIQTSQAVQEEKPVKEIVSESASDQAGPVEIAEEVKSADAEIAESFGTEVETPEEPLEGFTIAEEELADELDSQGEELAREVVVEQLMDVETQAAPSAKSQAYAADDIEKKKEDVRSKLKATGAVSRSAAATTSAEILDCNPAEGEKNRSFQCAHPESTEELNEYIRSNKTVENGSVLLELLIDEVGIIQAIEIQKPNNTELEKEAIRLLQGGPKWMSARMNGGFVSSKIMLVVNFRE